jgi:DNA-binding NarL/FixJ family response regulator
MSGVLIAHAQPVLRTTLRRLLSEHGLEIVAETADAESTVAAALRLEPAVCVIDDALPGGGLLAVKRITFRNWETRALVLVADVTPDIVVASVRSGATGVVPVTTTPTGLVRSVQAVLDGQSAIPRSATAALVRELRGRGRLRVSVDGRPLSLTEREQQVLELLRENLTTADIARELGVSQVTVRRHAGSIAAKAGERNRTDLLRAVGA